MSKAAEKFFENIKPPEQSIGAIEAVKEAVQAIAPGLSLSKFFNDIVETSVDMWNHGRTELVEGILNAHDGHIMYMKGEKDISQDKAPDHGLPVEAVKQPEVEQDRGGMGM